jgi:AbrB family looped-hinge helix DNA binding protein
MAVLQMSQKGQVLIPRKLRERVGLKPGAPVQVIEEPHQLVLKAVPPDPIAAATGCLGIQSSLTQDLLCEHKEESRRERKNRPR